MNTAVFVVVYDISDNKERARIVKLLKGYGMRIQKSVFECRLTKAGLKNLANSLKGLKIKTGFVKIYRLEHSFSQPTIGKKKPENIDDGTSFVV